MVRVATRVDPPRQDVFPPRKMLVVELAPPSGMLRGLLVVVIGGVVEAPPPTPFLLLHLLVGVG